MLYTEAVDNLAYRLGKSDDDPFKDRLARDISIARAEILRREINKRGSIPAGHEHVLHNLNIVEDKLGYLAPAFSSKKVWRTEQKIPKPLMYHDQPAGFVFVGGIDANIPHSYIKPERLSVRLSKFAESQYYTYVDEYLFFFDNIEHCQVRGVFSDILRVAEVKDADGNLCVIDMSIPDDLFTAIRKLILEDENEVGLNYNEEVNVNVDKP